MRISLLRCFAGLALLMGVAVAGDGIAEAAAQGRFPMPGQLVSVGDGRALHLLCEGETGPVIVVEQGAGEPAILWRGLQRQAAAFSRFCIYDRAGYGWSPPSPAFQPVEERARDLHSLLAAAGMTRPYILVAHSYGGLIARSFSQQFPGDVAGLVMVDAIEEGIAFHPEYLSFIAQSKSFVSNMRVAAERQAGSPSGSATRTPMVDDESFGAVAAAAFAASPPHYTALLDDLRSIEEAAARFPLPAGMGTLGDTPLIVITHGRPFPGPFARLEPFWLAGQRRFAGLSSRSELAVAEESNHMVAFDQPALVLDALRRMVNRVGSEPE